MRQRLAFPTVMVMFLLVVHRYEHLLFDLHLLNYRHWNVLHHRHRHVLDDRHFLVHRHFLDYRYMYRVRHLGHMVVVDCMHLVWNVDGHMFAETR